MLEFVFQKFNRLTLNKLMLYYLLFLIFFAFIFSFFGWLPFHPFALLWEVFILIIVSVSANHILKKIFNASSKIESVYITGLILVLIISPLISFSQIIFFVVAAILAMASKYLLAVNKRHIFNPAAIAVVITGLFMNHTASWWIGTTLMAPFVMIGGLLIVYKMRRFKMVGLFIVLTILLLTFNLLFKNSQNIFHILELALVQSSFLFFAFVMFTEPLTSPVTKKMQMIFAAIVGFLYVSPQLKPLGIVLTPELALSFGNIFSYIWRT